MNMSDIEVAKTHGGDRYLITIGDAATINVNKTGLIGVFLDIHSTYGELTSAETAQLAGALIAAETLTATGTLEEMSTLALALGTMNDVREKAGKTPLVNTEHIRDLIAKALKKELP